MKKTKKQHKFLNVIIPAHNEEHDIEECTEKLITHLRHSHISYSIIIVNDCSADNTGRIIDRLSKKHSSVMACHRKSDPGFGNAIREGIRHLNADYYALIMADASDDPADFVRMVRTAKREKPDAVFTNRFMHKGWVKKYPAFKLFCNRIGNSLISMLFMTKYNDLTNAFQLISSRMLDGHTLTSKGFELTVENSLNALVTGSRFCQEPVHWNGRNKGVSKFKINKIIVPYFSVIFRFLGKRYLTGKKALQ